MNEKIENAQKRMNRETVCFILPCVILVGAIFYTPFIISMYYSMTEWNGISNVAKFTGLSNFVKIFTEDTQFWQSIAFTAKYSLGFIIITNILALFLAAMLVKRLKTTNVLRAVFFVPYIMSMIIVGFIWRFIFSQGFSVLTEMTNWEVFKLSWLGDPNLSFFSVLAVSVWQSIGFYLVIYIAGLQAVPEDVLEAATVDGATGVTRFFRVTLPLIFPSITTCVFMALTNSIKVFDIILALTQGGPGSSTYSVTLNIYREAFQNNHYGLGSAKSLLLFVMVVFVTTLVLRLLKRKEVDT